MTMKSPIFSLFAFVLGFATSALGAEKETSESGNLRFARFTEKDTEAKLETVVSRYENEAGAKVELIGAVHIADAEYYDVLNERFKKYDAVLYEMVGGGAKADAPVDKKNALRFFQILYQQMLDLEFQMNGIDYSAGNFVHADMNWAQFSKRMKKKDENLFILMSKAFEHQEEMRAEGKGDGFFDPRGMMEAIYKGDSPDEIKLVVGKQFANMDVLMAGMEQGKGGSVLIGERNKVALKVLSKELKKGKRNLALFYGAAHLPGMDKQLTEKMGFKRTGVEWLVAWNVDKSAMAEEEEAKAAERKKDEFEVRKALPVEVEEKKKAA